MSFILAGLAQGFGLEDEIALQERKEAAQKFVADLDKEIKGESESSTKTDEPTSIEPPNTIGEKGPPV